MHCANNFVFHPGLFYRLITHISINNQVRFAIMQMNYFCLAERSQGATEGTCRCACHQASPATIPYQLQTHHAPKGGT